MTHDAFPPQPVKKRERWWIERDWLERKPIIGTDEYYQHTLVLVWPFNPTSHTKYGPTYRAIVVRLPTHCARPLRDEMDRLRDIADDVWAPKYRDDQETT